MLSFPDLDGLSDDVRRLFEEFDRTHAEGRDAAVGMHTPLLDVLDTGQTIEVLLDVPGVPPDAIRVHFKGGVLLVVGEKLPAGGDGRDPTAFHLVERGFGRFARVVRLAVAVDAGRARATLSAGELRISVPRLVERRGREIRIPLTPPDA